MIRKSEPNSESMSLLKNLVNRIIFVIKQKQKMYGEFAESFKNQIIKLMPEEMVLDLLNFGLKHVSYDTFALYCIFNCYNKFMIILPMHWDINNYYHDFKQIFFLKS